MLRCLHPQRPGLSLHPQRPVLILHPSFQACSTHKPRHTPTTRCGPNSVTCWAALPRLCSTSMTEILVFRSAYGWAYGAASPPCCWLQSVMSRLSPPTARLARTVVVGSNKTVVMRWLYILSYFIRCNEVLELEIAPKRYALAPKEAPPVSMPPTSPLGARGHGDPRSLGSAATSLSSVQTEALLTDDPYKLSATPMPVDGTSVPNSVRSPLNSVKSYGPSKGTLDNPALSSSSSDEEEAEDVGAGVARDSSAGDSKTNTFDFDAAEARCEPLGSPPASLGGADRAERERENVCAHARERQNYGSVVLVCEYVPHLPPCSSFSTTAPLT